MIFNIQRFSLHDGVGIRTIVFFKGCTLRCKWCNNPESLSFNYDIMHNSAKCISCMSCVRASPNGEILYKNGEIRINRDRINEPLKYSEVCPTKALTVVGEIKSVYEIIGEIKKDSSFYNKSNGGVTLSGGESLAQKKFLFPLLKRLKEENIHVCIETSLHTNWTNIYDCVEYIDVFLADLKHTDEKKFKEFTDGDLQLVLENFKRLESMDAKVIVRVPVIPTFNNTKKEMKGIMRIKNM